MYPTAWRVLKSNIVIIIGLAITMALLELWLGESLNTAGLLVVYGFIAYYAHRSALLGESFNNLRGTPETKDAMKFSSTWPFLWRYIALWPLLLVLSLGFMFALLVTVDTGTDDAMRPYVIWGSVGCAVVVVVLLTAVFGTVFPAAAIGGNKGLGAAFHRGRLTFWKTLGRICAGPVLWTCFGFAILIAAFGVFPETSTFNPVLFGISALAWMIGFFNTILVAVILSLAYQETELDGLAAE